MILMEGLSMHGQSLDIYPDMGQMTGTDRHRWQEERAGFFFKVGPIFSEKQDLKSCS